MKRAILVFFGLMMSILPHVQAMPPASCMGGREPSRPHVFGHERLTRYSERLPVIGRQPYETEEYRGICILVNYADESFQATNTKAAFDSLANAKNYTYDGAIGSVKEYFREQSAGFFVPHFDVVGPVTLPRTNAWYGTDRDYRGDDRYVGDLVVDACHAAKGIGVNFADYDSDEDGQIDFVYIIYAGFGQADGGESWRIWPFEWDMESVLYFGNASPERLDSFYVEVDEDLNVLDERLPMFDGKTVMRYACSNELRHNDSHRIGISTMCHEFCHVLGLPDYYVTAAGVPQQYAGEEPGQWSLMSNGAYNNNGRTPPNFSVYDKYYLGWVSPSLLVDPQIVTLPADGQTYYKYKTNNIDPADGAFSRDTVWYIENRQQTGWDEYLPGAGVVTWQVVYDEDEWENNTVNNNTTRYCIIDIEEGEGTLDYNFRDYHPTGLCQPVVQDAAQSLWYNIIGQPVGEQYRGVVISNGRKQIRL